MKLNFLVTHRDKKKDSSFLPNMTVIIHCYPRHVVVGISSCRNSTKANSRVIREINKPMLNAEKKRIRKMLRTLSELNAIPR